MPNPSHGVKRAWQNESRQAITRCHFPRRRDSRQLQTLPLRAQQLIKGISYSILFVSSCVRITSLWIPISALLSVFSVLHNHFLRAAYQISAISRNRIGFLLQLMGTVSVLQNLCFGLQPCIGVFESSIHTSIICWSGSLGQKSCKVDYIAALKAKHSGFCTSLCRLQVRGYMLQ